MSGRLEWTAGLLTQEFPDLTGFRALGKGSFAHVFEVTHPHLGVVALKILTGTDELQDDEEGRSVFRDLVRTEIRAVGKLGGGHNIVTLHTSGESASGWPYQLMELCSGGSLAAELLQRLRSGAGPLSPSEVAEVGRQMARALARTHDAQILHLDIKPANILIDRFGAYKLADFGVARSFELAHSAAGGPPASAVDFLTPHYAGPEMWMEPSRPCPESDIYSLGATLFHLASGERVFEDQSATNRGVNILKWLRPRVEAEPPRRLEEFGIPAALADLVDVCLAKNPDDRPKAQNLIRALDLMFVETDDATVVFQPTVRKATIADTVPADISTVGPPSNRSALASVGNHAESHSQAGPPQPSHSTGPTTVSEVESNAPRRAVGLKAVGLVISSIVTLIAIFAVLSSRDSGSSPGTIADSLLAKESSMVAFPDPSERAVPPGILPGQAGGLTVSGFDGQSVLLSWMVATPEADRDYVVLGAIFKPASDDETDFGPPQRKGLLAPNGTIIERETDPILRLGTSARSTRVAVDPAAINCFMVGAVSTSQALPSDDSICWPNAYPKAPIAGTATVTGGTATITWTDQSDDETGFVVIGIADGEGGKHVVSMDTAASGSTTLDLPHTAGACYVVRAENAYRPTGKNLLGTPFTKSTPNQSIGMCDPAAD